MGVLKSLMPSPITGESTLSAYGDLLSSLSTLV